METLRTNRIREIYGSLSLDAMGVFRVAFGLVHLADLLRRWPMIELLYSNDGVLSNHFLLFRPPSPHYFSLLSAFSSPAGVQLYFCLLGAALCSFIVGYRTRLFHLVCAVGFISLHQRNVLIEYGGDVVSNVFWVLTLLLPLGARCSLDSRRLRAQASARSERFFSLAASLCLLQFSVIYFLNAWQKSGSSWIDGSALYYTLRQDRAVTALGAWVAASVPDLWLRYASWGTRWVEYAIPLLLLLPVRRTFCRAAALFLVWALHLGIALMLNIGIFSPLMMSIALLFLEGRPAQGLAAGIDRCIAAIAGICRWPAAPAQSEDSKRISWAREAGAAFLLYVVLSQLVRDNPALAGAARLPQPDWVSEAVGYSRMFQGWTLFAPDVPHSDGWLVMDLELKSGAHFDPQTGRTPSYGRAMRTALSWQQAWDSYSLRISFERFAVYRAELERWITERGKGLHAFDPNEVRGYRVWWVWDITPTPGGAYSAPAKTLLLEGRRSNS